MTTLICAYYHNTKALWFNVETGHFDSPIPIEVCPNKYDRKPYHIEHLRSLYQSDGQLIPAIERFNLPADSLGSLQELNEYRKATQEYEYRLNNPRVYDKPKKIAMLMYIELRYLMKKLLGRLN